MAVDFEYDDTNLQHMFEAIQPKQRLKALRGAFRREANKFRRKAIKNLRSSIRSDRDLERGVRAIVFKRAAGFRVTVGPKQANRNGKGGRGFHQNQRGLKKPVLIWAEAGTEQRQTKSRIFWRKRKGHSTGRMKRYGFMAKTRDEISGSITESLRNEVINSIKKEAKKYGCT